MSFYETYSQYKDFDWSAPKEYTRLAELLSPAAEEHLEEMATIAHQTTLKYFGKTIQLYTPMYLSNYCDNRCVYCGFNSSNNIARHRLNIEEVEKEAKAIASTGLKHILILTGESRSMSPISYIKDCVRVLKKYFSSIAIEIYPLEEDEYKELVLAGVDSLTIYQEVYDEAIYSDMHPAGPKKDYRFRLDAPERGARAGMRGVNIGSLLGLDDWRKEVFLTVLHAKYLEDKFPDIEIGISIPRMRPHAGDFKVPFEVSDKNMVQIILAIRLILPRAGISVSTRESPDFRENLIPLGITRMSAGSTTKVGGHTIGAEDSSTSAQFDISDRRSVAQMKALLERKGYQPVLKDWMQL